jgi:hypothetical protein
MLSCFTLLRASGPTVRSWTFPPSLVLRMVLADARMLHDVAAIISQRACQLTKTGERPMRVCIVPADMSAGVFSKGRGGFNL